MLWVEPAVISDDLILDFKRRREESKWVVFDDTAIFGYDLYNITVRCWLAYLIVLPIDAGCLGDGDKEE